MSIGEKCTYDYYSNYPAADCAQRASRGNLSKGGIICEFSFFLGANSKDGFYSLYGGFGSAPGDYLTVIKGGPGTGKSGFMRKDRARGRGARAGRGIRFMLRRSGLSTGCTYLRCTTAGSMGPRRMSSSRGASALMEIINLQALLPLWSDR